MGLGDLVAQIRERDATAFVDEQQTRLEAGKARFTDKLSNNPGGAGTTKEEIMAIKDRAERRKAIAEHPALFGLTATE